MSPCRALLAGVGGVVALRVLARQPRGNTVKCFHGLPNLKRVQFAEQVQVRALAWFQGFQTLKP